MPCMDFTAEGAMNKNPHVKGVLWRRQTSNAVYLNISAEPASYKFRRIQGNPPLLEYKAIRGRI